jgi:hypothetical protein
MICHGQGEPQEDPFLGGCCFINGSVCPHRWFIDRTGPEPVIVNHQRVVLGTLTAYINTLFNSGPRRTRAQQMLQGTNYGCGVILTELAQNGVPTGGNWATELDTRWSALYAEGAVADDVGDAWAAIGKPRNWCVSYGPGEDQCCFGETQTVNDQRATALHVTRVTIASRSTLGG